MLDVFSLACAPVNFVPERLAATLAQAWAWTKVNDLGEIIRDAEFQGSNNWAVHGSRTKPGRPVLATDPHRTHAIPSLRYLVHLTAPGLDVIGMGEPAVPGITMGHNGTAAFGLTIFGADQEDVLVYETSGESYRYGDAWEPVRTLQERFVVRGSPDQILHAEIHPPRPHPARGCRPLARLCAALGVVGAGLGGLHGEPRRHARDQLR